MYTCGTERLLIFHYFIDEELEDESGYAAVDADKKVDGGENHVGCTGHREDERGRVHQWSDGPTIVGHKCT